MKTWRQGSSRTSNLTPGEAIKIVRHGMIGSRSVTVKRNGQILFTVSEGAVRDGYAQADKFSLSYEVMAKITEMFKE